MGKILFAEVFLGFAFLLYRNKGITLRSGRRLFLWYLIAQLTVLVAVCATTWQQWHLDNCGTACRYFFPPYSNYYFNQVIARWMNIAAFNAMVGLAGGILFSIFARMTHGTIIDQIDVDLLTVGGMAAGWPNILIFYAIVFLSTMVVTLLRAVIERSVSVRMIVTPVLPMTAAAVALFGDKLAHWLHLYSIGITVL